jgi:hypothetical protein
MNTKKIKEEFKKEFIHNKSLLGMGNVHATGESVWSFIESHLTQVREETLEEVEKIIPKGKGNDYENLGMGSLDYHEKNAVDGYIEWLKAHISKLKK